MGTHGSDSDDQGCSYLTVGLTRGYKHQDLDFSIRMTAQDINETIGAFAQGARRSRQAGLDGVEIQGGDGYLINQFLSSAVNDRADEHGGSLENRSRTPRRGWEGLSFAG